MRTHFEVFQRFLSLSFDVTRQEGANTAPDHGVQLEVSTRWWCRVWLPPQSVLLE